MAALRLVVAAGLAVLLGVVIAQLQTGGVKGMRVPLFNIASAVALAAVAAVVCRLRVNRLSGWIGTPFVGGIAGSFGILNGVYGPFGGAIGFLVGAIVLILPGVPGKDSVRSGAEVDRPWNDGGGGPKS